MTDKEKIRAEIERRINSWSIRGKNSPVGQGKDTCVSRVTELSDLLSFIDSLTEEPTPKESDDLEEAAIDFADGARKQLFTKDYAVSSIADYDHGCVDGFKAGAEWQKKKFEAEYELDWITDLKKDLYELGRKDEREQMRKDAVEADVNTFRDLVAGKSWAEFVVEEMPTDNLGEKVKIIILKDDENIND